MGRKIEILVPPRKERERLDKFLAREVSRLSRSLLQKLIEEERVLVNGKPTKPHHLILPNEKIEIHIPQPQKLEVIPEDIPLDIIYEDENLLVVNKRAGMVVHPALGNYSGTLVNALLYHCKHLSVVSGNLRPGLVHRLDKDTSGLLVVAKDDQTHRKLALQFSRKEIEREYWAIVWGNLKEKEGRIQTHIGRNPKNRKKMAVVSEGKTAVTNYRVIKEFDLLSLIGLKLETGRTHQIRVHLSHIGHPVFGDGVYGGRNKRLGSLSNRDRERAAKLLEMMPRQALHAKTLGFFHPVKKEFMRFDSKLPRDMGSLLEELRN